MKEAGMPTGGALLVDGLARAGAEVAFGLPGVHNLAAWTAFRGSRIRLVGVRHEQTAAYAADGYARTSGHIGVALTTTGPGAANTLGAVGEAWASGSPLLVIATDIPSTLRVPGVYRGVLHECVDQPGMFAPVTKATLRAERTEDISALVVEAAGEALAAPSRPVYLEIPTDLLSGTAVTGARPAVGLPADPPADLSNLDLALRLLEEAERPLIWAGGGALRAGAGPILSALALHLSAPVLLTYQARGLLPPEHPCLVGLPPHVPEAGTLWDEADLVLAVGTDFDGMMTQNWSQPPPLRMVAVNVDPQDATKNYPADAVLAGDATEILTAICERAGRRDGSGALAERLSALRAQVSKRIAQEHPDAAGFLDAVAEAVPGTGTIVADMCIPGYWLGAFGRITRPRGLAYPVGWGTLGFAFPAALGAALAGAGPVVSFSGDGGFLFACGELATMAQEDIPLTAVIVDDGGYGMLRFDQHHAGEPAFGVDLHTPDFVGLAQAFGIRAESVEGLGPKFGEALARHVAENAPSVLVARARLDPPPSTSPRWYRRA